MAHASDPNLFPIRREPRNIWERTGLTPTQRRRLDYGLGGLVALLLGGWTFTAAQAVAGGTAPAIARSIGNAPSLLSPEAPPAAAFLMEEARAQFVDWDDQFRGASGEVRVVLRQPGDTLALPDSLPSGVEVAYQDVEAADSAAVVPASPTSGTPQPGIWNVVLRTREAIREATDVNIITLVPASEKRDGRIGSYRIGNWPVKGGMYEAPRGFVRVTPENRNTQLSTHFKLGDFVTKGQENVWPKYVVISPRLLDKLELTIQELEAAGHPVEDVFVVSGFRTPWYNAAGGNTQGRGALSRHMYGDASDIAIDNDGNSLMDDLNGDGSVDFDDAKIIAAAAERVEKKHPHLIGGIGIYRRTGAHWGMVHLDTRGSRARW